MISYANIVKWNCRLTCLWSKISTFQAGFGAIQKYCHAHAYFFVQYHMWKFSNGVLYDILPQGASDLPEVKVKPSKKGYFY